jgi:hypothetical protein
LLTERTFEPKKSRSGKDEGKVQFKQNKNKNNEI